MQDYSSRSKHFRALASMVGTTYGQWAIFMLIEDVITHSTEGDGILSKEKIKYKISDHILDIYRRYYSRLKPVGGSYAGAKKPAPTPGANTRASTSTTPPAAELVEDTTGDSDLQQLIKDITSESRLDERDAQTVHTAAAYFKLILEKVLEDPVYGLRRNANKFHSFQAGNRDALQIMDDIMQELHPLEILIVGPEVTMIQEFTHSTSHAAALRVDDITRWQNILFNSFRSSTSTADMSDRLLMDRRPHLRHLAYLTSTSFEHRLKTRHTNGNTTFHAARSEVQAVINKIILNKTMTGEQITAELRPILKLHPGTNLRTINWRSSAPRGKDTPIRANTTRVTTDGHEANVSRFSVDDATTDDKRKDSRSPHHRKGPKSHPAQSRRVNKSGTTCKDCGQEGHWGGDPECPHAKGRQTKTNNSNANTKGQKNSKTLHWSATTSQ